MIKLNKILLAIAILLSGILIVGCDLGEKEIEAFAVVNYETTIMGEQTGKILFGNQNSSDYTRTTVYHYKEKTNSIQLQPTKFGDVITNVDVPWSEIESIEIITNQFIYVRISGFPVKHELVNDSEIDVYKIIIHQKMGSMIIIDEILVIRVSDVQNFEFNYKIEELE